MHAKQVLEMMGEVKTRLGRPDTRQYLDGFIQDMIRKGDLSLQVMVQDKTAGEAFAFTQETFLGMSEAFAVDAEMNHLVRWAAQGLNDDDTFEQDLWPTPFGFLVLEEAWVSLDRWNHQMVTKAFSWGRFRGVDRTGRQCPGTMVVFYTDLNDARDQVTLNGIAMAREREGDTGAQAMGNFFAGLGRLQANHLMFIPDGGPVGPSVFTHTEDEVARRKAFVGDFETGEHAKSSENQTRQVLALLMLLNQTVTATRTEHPPAKAGPRFAKRRLPSAITVITLRRTAGASRGEGESMVQWAHRWIVRGFWAWRKCGPEHPGAVEYEKGHRNRVWIAPYLKNADRTDLPFKQSEKVYHLSR